MASNGRWLVYWAVGLALWLLPNCSGGQEAAPVSSEVIIREWQARQNLVQTGRFTWTEHRFEAKGWKKNPNMPAFINPKGLVVPPEDVSYELSSYLSFDRNKIRYALKNVNPDKRYLPYEIPFEHIRVSNGQTVKLFFSPQGEAGYPQGQLIGADSKAKGKQRSEQIRNQSYLKPFLWTFFPATEFDLRRMSISPLRGVVDGKDCIILEDVSGRFKRALWLDPSRGFVVARSTRHQDGQLIHQFDISYLKDEQHNLWIPQKWTYATQFANGSPRLSASGELKRYEINLALDPSEFEYEFPPGTWVSVAGSDEMYIQKESGTKRPITQEEWGADYPQYLNSESGLAFSTGSTAWKWVGYGLGVLLIGAVLFTLWWVMKKRKLLGA